jgi:hypothetical protein
MAISAVLTQILLPSKRGGRVPVAELLMIGYGARRNQGAAPHGLGTPGNPPVIEDHHP